MKAKKLIFKDIKSLLSRDEMKKIMGGSGNNKCNVYCKSNSDCDTVCAYCNDDYGGAGGKTCGKS